MRCLIAALLLGSSVLTPTQALARERMRGWIERPALYVRQVFGATPDPWQDEVLDAFPHNPRQALIACKGPGKTTVLSWLNWHFLSTRPHPNMAATAITGANLRDNLWKEMAVWRARSPELLEREFELDTGRIYRRGHSETWFLSARTWNRDGNEQQQGDTLAGLHSLYVMVTLDEGGGIPQAVMKAADGVMANLGTDSCEEAHVLLAGNPTQLSGPLHRAAHDDRPEWWVKQVTGDPDDVNRAPRVSLSWAKRKIEKLGRDHYDVRVDVLGLFPLGDADALLTSDQFDAAFDRWGKRDSLASEPRALGVDVARHGKDRTVVFPRAGDLVLPPTSWQGQDTQYSAHKVAEIADAWMGSNEAGRRLPIYVDDIGVGGGVTDALLALGYQAIGVIVDAAPTTEKAKKKHANLKSQICGAIQDRSREGNLAIDPIIRELTTLVAEGVTLKIGFSAGRRKVEGKDEYKRRTGRSTDFWDAMMLAFAGDVGLTDSRVSGHAQLAQRQLAERAAAAKQGAA